MLLKLAGHQTGTSRETVEKTRREEGSSESTATGPPVRRCEGPAMQSTTQRSTAWLRLMVWLLPAACCGVVVVVFTVTNADSGVVASG